MSLLLQLVIYDPYDINRCLLLQSIKTPCMLLIITSMGSFPTAVRTVSLPTDARDLDFLASAAAPCDEEVMLR